MSDDDVIGLLTRIKAGRWTVEMVLMFALGREDVFAVDDLGIQQAICKIYKIDPADKRAMKEQMLAVSKKMESLPHVRLPLSLGLEGQYAGSRCETGEERKKNKG